MINCIPGSANVIEKTILVGERLLAAQAVHALSVVRDPNRFIRDRRTVHQHSPNERTFAGAVEPGANVRIAASWQFGEYFF